MQLRDCGSFGTYDLLCCVNLLLYIGCRGLCRRCILASLLEFSIARSHSLFQSVEFLLQVLIFLVELIEFLELLVELLQKHLFLCLRSRFNGPCLGRFRCDLIRITLCLCTYARRQKRHSHCLFKHLHQSSPSILSRRNESVLLRLPRRLMEYFQRWSQSESMHLALPRTKLRQQTPP